MFIPDDLQQQNLHLVQRWQETHDQSAIEEILSLNRPTILYILRRFYIPTSLYDDYLQVGNIALYRAADTYDPSSNMKVGNYFIQCIKYMIQNFMSEAQTSLIPVPKYLFYLQQRILKDQQERAQQHLPPLTHQELANKYRISVDTVVAIINIQTISYNVSVVGLDEADERNTIEHYLADNSMEEEIEARVMKEELWKYLQEKLTPTEYTCLRAYFSEDEPTYCAIANNLHVSYQRVQQLIQRALSKLRYPAALKTIAEITDIPLDTVQRALRRHVRHFC